MSLVAYDYSSEEDSHESDEEGDACERSKGALLQSARHLKIDQISDDEDDTYMEHQSEEIASSFSLSLPKPQTESSIKEIVGKLSTLSALPPPKSVHVHAEEEDDEFLHKKDKFVTSETKPSVHINKGPVKISIPSLKEFQDVKDEMTEKSKLNTGTKERSEPRGSGLLSILPKAKSEQNFSKAESNQSGDVAKAKQTPFLIPDTVKYRRPAYSTEGTLDEIKPIRKPNPKHIISNTNTKPEEEKDETEKSLENSNDFFSLNDDDNILPEISSNEISIMVAKKAAKIAEVTANYLKEAEVKSAREEEVAQRNQLELDAARKRYHDTKLDTEAERALVGSSAKRRRNKNYDINIVDLNSDQILPDRDEWMRTALASSTTYQPTGVLVDEEPASGTRRKHQITYLAHKAKANEAELQAMWAANRQNRRATQSKYGF